VHGVFCSLVDHRFLAETNDHPKPFVWAANPGHIIAAANGGLLKWRFDPFHEHGSLLHRRETLIFSMRSVDRFSGEPAQNHRNRSVRPTFSTAY
jgi:hypothetical protein